MKNETMGLDRQTIPGQSEEEARAILESCLVQLAASSVGDPDWVDATNRLGQMEPAFARLQLDALADESYQVCRALSIALSRIGPSIFEAVVQTVSHDHPRAREFACGLIYGLHQRGGVDIQQAVGPLATALQDEDCRVRQRAVVTLCQIGAEASGAIGSLTAALFDPEDYVREWAAHALAALGPVARSATFALQQSLGDPEPSVREAALNALQAVRKEA